MSEPSHLMVDEVAMMLHLKQPSSNPKSKKADSNSYPHTPYGSTSMSKHPNCLLESPQYMLPDISLNGKSDIDSSTINDQLMVTLNQ